MMPKSRPGAAAPSAPNQPAQAPQRDRVDRARYVVRSSAPRRGDPRHPRRRAVRCPRHPRPPIPVGIIGFLSPSADQPGLSWNHFPSCKVCGSGGPDSRIWAVGQISIAASRREATSTSRTSRTFRPAVQVGSNDEVAAALAAGEANLAAGTAWLWAHAEMAAAVDVLVIDEAGQMSLANTLAVCQAAGSLVLLGDPRQLDQPIQGVHPPGADVSALGHLLGESATVDPARGVFLDQTWRMHPDICAFTTEQFYEGRLRPQPELRRQTVVGTGPLVGHGLRFIPVAHAGNTNASAEEAECVAGLIRELLDAGGGWVDRQDVQRRLTLDDVLAVAPYNAHVAVLRSTLPGGARVGTVDKFQGQEAPIVIYSMATSTADEAPRGMEFLYSLHRLNVATSRARCVAAIVASPVLLTPDCRTPEQMRLANPFCRFLELATPAPGLARRS